MLSPEFSLLEVALFSIACLIVGAAIGRVQ